MDEETAVGVGIGVTIGVLLIIALVTAIFVKKKCCRAAAAPLTSHPIGVMFTDIQSSAELWSEMPNAMGSVVDEHNTIMRRLIEKHKCYEVKTIGDAFMVVSEDPEALVSLAVELQEEI